jgi:hypothetical protein
MELFLAGRDLTVNLWHVSTCLGSDVFALDASGSVTVQASMDVTLDVTAAAQHLFLEN